MEKNTKKVLLASGSPRRRLLLDRLGFTCETAVSTVDEIALMKQGGSPAELAERCALAKAKEVALRIGANALVLGADTVVALDCEVFGKPDDRNEARRMLENLSGREHTVITGVALVDLENKIEYVDHEVTRVRMGHYDSAMIEAYLDTEEPMDKAGAYGIQGYGGILVEGIEGCFFNVMGLPLFRLERLLNKRGLSLMPGG